MHPIFSRSFCTKVQSYRSCIRCCSSSSSPLSLRRATVPHCDVFISHRGVDTKRNLAGLLCHRLAQHGLNPFLDSKNMKPGDKLFEAINSAILNCKLGVALFSPRYCDSYFCLHELALMMEAKKKVIPIFCDVKPSELRVVDQSGCSQKELEKFNRALQESKLTVGLTFNSQSGNWSELLNDTARIVMASLNEGETRETVTSLF